MRSSRLAWSMPFIILYASATFPPALLLSKIHNNPALFNVALYERLSDSSTHFLCPCLDHFYFCCVFEIRWPKVNMIFKVKDMALIYMAALKCFLFYDLSSLTTLTLYSVSLWLTTSTILQSSHLNWADFIDSYTSTNSKHKRMTENLNLIVYYFIMSAKHTVWLALEFLKL